MIIKLTSAGKNEAVYVNFNFVRIMRRDGAFTELTLSDDRYHRLAVLETPEDIYDILYPSKHCSGSCHCHETENKAAIQEALAVETKKPAAKKTTAKAAETN